MIFEAKTQLHVIKPVSKVYGLSTTVQPNDELQESIFSLRFSFSAFVSSPLPVVEISLAHQAEETCKLCFMKVVHTGGADSQTDVLFLP